MNDINLFTKKITYFDDISLFYVLRNPISVTNPPLQTLMLSQENVDNSVYLTLINQVVYAQEDNNS